MRQMAGGAYPRPCIAEMGGKNPCIVTEHADLERAAAGIVRSAYGMGGQKCSALSRLYVHEKRRRRADRAPAGADRGASASATRAGANTGSARWSTPPPTTTTRATSTSCATAARPCSPAAPAAGATAGDLARGYYVEPVLAEAPLAHPLWQQEMFLPILMLHRYRDRDEAMRAGQRHRRWD